ncbi:MAG TPA: c-type cytochrome [Holophagaceae bacterium]|nr:c-type cytochrome [Holophagaceae bacterium]
MRPALLSILRPALVLGLGLSMTAAPAPKARKPEPGKNLQVFKGKGLDERSLDAAMDFMSASLGVSCTHCHVRDEAKKTLAFDRDDLPAKQTARRMIRMVRALNKTHFNGADVISCATCHAGHVKPEAMPPLREVGAARPAPAKPAAPADLPSVDSLLAKWVEASGGREALLKASPRRSKGTLDLGGGRTLALEVLQAEGRQHSTLTTPRGTLTEVFDGKQGWTLRGGKAEPVEGSDATLLAMEADLQLPLHLAARFPSLTVLGKDTVDGKDAITVAAKADDGTRALLAFDAASGLLVRRTTFTATPLGRMAEETTWQDFRAVDGLQVPFKAVNRSPERATVATFSEIQPGAAVDPALFKRP